ncbi:thioredoxin family protein [Virgibacillus sp. MG-45]|uniref:thioredoxin family protein n=1 Tax=Virgibacillus sp. MG-45 TaxID=3102791 RepID=UPI002ED77447
MQKKMLMIVGVIVILFAALYFVNDYKTNKTMDDNENPYGKEGLDQATVNQLDDPNYQNQITPDALKEKLDNKEDVTVYFYSPTCSYCQNTTPVLVPLAEEMNVDIKKMNLLEFKTLWDLYEIEGVPTLVHYENGKEVARISSEQPEESFRAFLTENIIE